ncbi:MAG: SRPBCC domain-containing protein [Candidatus Heimdallarchaeota archaeon]|nr:SRPBCC domain-containing protein [Candidatus Heimdallarchaeota archaeon]
MSYSWDHFKRKVYIKAPLDEVYRAISTADGLVTWFIKNAEYTKNNGEIRQGDVGIQVGDQYYWRWHQNLETRGIVLKIVPQSLIEFTFGKKSKDSEENVVVRFEVDYKDGETIFSITQDNMGGELSDQALYHLSCNMGWSFFMTNMKAVLEYGIDLRETDEVRAYETRAVSL